MSKRRSNYANIYHARGARQLTSKVSTFGVTTSAAMDPKEKRQRERVAARRLRLKELTVGQVVKGRVAQIKPFGLIVDLPQSRSFVHISEISWSFVSDPHLLVKVGQSVKARITSIDLDKLKVNLSIKRITCRVCATTVDKSRPSGLCRKCATKSPKS